VSGLAPLTSASAPATLADVLAWCEQGKQAIVEAESVARAHDLLGVASTLEHAVRARDLGAEAAVAASALRVRAERRVGQLLAQQPKAPPGPRPIDRSTERTDPPTLAEQGISKNESSAYQRLAAVPDPDFEQAVEAEERRAREQGGTNVTRSGVMRLVQPETEMRTDEWWLAADRFTRACKDVQRHTDVATKAARFGHYPGDEPKLVHAGIERTLRNAREAIDAVLGEIERRKA
jgi:hypothetical protein